MAVGRLRSMLFAPAVRPDLLAKLPAAGADAVVIDCEDATPANAKSAARMNARAFSRTLADAGLQAMVRANPPTSSWFEQDIAEALTPAVSAVVIPKVEKAANLDRVDKALRGAGLPDLGVVAGIETVLGVADARALLAHPRVTAAYFGAEDFIADIGGRRTPGNQEVLFARSAVAIAARLAGIPVVDQVVIDFRNDEQFSAECQEAAALGYSGKLCIHPRQVVLANAVFTPSPEEIDRARRLLAAYTESAAKGIAAIDFEGQMVDAPVAAQARHLLTSAGGASE